MGLGILAFGRVVNYLLKAHLVIFTMTSLGFLIAATLVLLPAALENPLS